MFLPSRDGFFAPAEPSTSAPSGQVKSAKRTATPQSNLRALREPMQLAVAPRFKRCRMDDDIFLPAEIDVIHARLPQLYQAAKAALAECDRIDECREWQNKHDAIASYARQANDTQLETYARRIKARAARQCGKLLSEVDARKNGG